MSASNTSLAEAFTKEHHQIDAGIEAYLDSTTLEPRERTQPLLSALEALRRHIYLEEELIFPYLPQATLMMPLMVMYREHGELWQQMNQLEESLADPAASSGELDAACREILALLDRHNSKEEPIIYPYMDSDLSEQDQQSLHTLLETGTLPPGWVCRNA